MKFSSFRSIGHTATHGVIFGLSAAIMITLVSLVYAGVTNIYYSDLPNVSSWSGLTASSWNNLVNYANKAVKQDTEVLTVTGGKVGIGTVSPWATLEVNGSVSSQGPAGEANRSTSFSAATGGNTTITGFTANASVSVGGGFTPSTGIFQPTIAGRYLFTIYGYSGTQWNWTASIIKNDSTGTSGGAVSVPGNGNIANTSYVVNLNGSSDFVNFKIANYSGVTVNLTSVIVTWTKLP